MSTAAKVNSALLRPAILHILRAQGYHSARPSVIETLTDIAARYIMLLGLRTAEHAALNHNTQDPDVTDARMAMQDCAALIPTATSTQEVWSELFRKPLGDYEEEGRRKQEEKRRMDADTQEIRSFIDWFSSEQYEAIKRIAGLAPSSSSRAVETEAMKLQEDYLTALKKKHSKTGEESRYQGTILGKQSEGKPIKIEGGPAESIQEWVRQTQERSAQEAAIRLQEGQSLKKPANQSGPTPDPSDEAMDTAEDGPSQPQESTQAHDEPTHPQDDSSQTLSGEPLGGGETVSASTSGDILEKKETSDDMDTRS